MTTAKVNKKINSPPLSPLPSPFSPLLSSPLLSSPLLSSPLHSTPLHSTPLHSTPLHSTPLHSTPLHSTLSTPLYPLHSAPLHSIDPSLAQPRIELGPPALEVVFLPLRYRTLDAGGNSNLYTSTCLHWKNCSGTAFKSVQSWDRYTTMKE